MKKLLFILLAGVSFAAVPPDGSYTFNEETFEIFAGTTAWHNTVFNDDGTLSQDSWNLPGDPVSLVGFGYYTYDGQNLSLVLQMDTNDGAYRILNLTKLPDPPPPPEPETTVLSELTAIRTALDRQFSAEGLGLGFGLGVTTAGFWLLFGLLRSVFQERDE